MDKTASAINLVLLQSTNYLEPISEQLTVWHYECQPAACAYTTLYYTTVTIHLNVCLLPRECYVNRLGGEP